MKLKLYRKLRKLTSHCLVVLISLRITIALRSFSYSFCLLSSFSFPSPRTKHPPGPFSPYPFCFRVILKQVAPLAGLMQKWGRPLGESFLATARLSQIWPDRKTFLLKRVPAKLCQQKNTSCSLVQDAIMRISTISFGLLALLTPLTAAWSKDGKLYSHL